MDLAARQLLRAIRGKRSQVAFARRLGYRGNPIPDWESGRRTPTAAELFRACERVHIDARKALARFHAGPPPRDPADPGELAVWLTALRGSTPIVRLAERAGASRFAVSRWLAGRSQPRVHEFLSLVDAITARACDLAAELVPIEQVPALLSAHLARAAARRLAHEQPWTEAILRVLEARPFRRGTIAAQLGIDQATEDDCLKRLLDAGIAVPDAESGNLQVVGALTVDTRAAARLKAHWAAVAQNRLEGPLDEDLFAYNVLSVAPEDLDEIRERLRAAFREIRTLVSNSKSAERVALVNLQLVTFPEQDGGRHMCRGSRE